MRVDAGHGILLRHARHGQPLRSSCPRRSVERESPGDPNLVAAGTKSQQAARILQPHKNKMIFALLMNKSPFRRISEVAGIGPSGLYGKIDFLHEQCLAFAAARELVKSDSI